MFSRWNWLLLCLSLGWAHPGQAIVTRHDRPDHRYLALETDFPQVFYLHTRYDHKVCMATLIDPHWALTAAHCTDDTPIGATVAAGQSFAVTIAGRPNLVTTAVVHPTYRPGELLTGTDLALLYLDSPVIEVNPARLNEADDEVDRVLDLVGWGYSGVGTRGRLRNDGLFRRAQNRVEAAADWLEFRFDDPRDPVGGALDLEGVPGLGDSGGPALLRSDGSWLLMGIAVGEMEPADPSSAQGLYGAVEIYERISRHLEWIRGTMTRERVATTAASP